MTYCTIVGQQQDIRGGGQGNKQIGLDIGGLDGGKRRASGGQGGQNTYISTFT